jgi:hypothetical protein
MVDRRTQSRRLASKLRELKAALARRRHLPIPAQGAWLRAVVLGYSNYHAVPGNIHRLRAFAREAERLWRRALLRRSHRHRLPWRRFARIARRWIPRARVLHPYPNVRFDARHPRQEPGAVVPHAGICAGGAG